MKKKIVALGLSSVMMVSGSLSFASVGNGSVYNLDGTEFAAGNEMNLSTAKRNQVNTQGSKFLYGFGGKLYKMSDAQAAYLESDQDMDEFVNKIVEKVEVEVEEGELKVTKVSAITKTGFSGEKSQLEFAINGETKAADLKAVKEAGYTVEFQSTVGVDGDGKLEVVATNDFSYKVVVKKDGKVVAESEEIDVTVLVGTNPKTLDEVVVKKGEVEVKTLVTGEEYNIVVNKLTNLKGEENKDVKTNPDLKYKTSNPMVAIVNSNGKITTIGKGTAKITMTSEGMEDYVLTIVVKDEERKATTIEGLKDVNVAEEESEELTLVVKDQYGDIVKGAEIGVKSTTPTTATTTATDAEGKVKVTIKGVSKGSTTVEVTVKGTDVKETINVTVKEVGKIVSYELQGDKNKFDLKDKEDEVKISATLKFVGKDKNGVAKDLSGEINDVYTVETSDKDIVTVNDLKITAKAVGTAKIVVKEGTIERAVYEVEVVNTTAPKLETIEDSGITVEDNVITVTVQEYSAESALLTLEAGGPAKVTSIKLGSVEILANEEYNEELAKALAKVGNFLDYQEKFELKSNLSKKAVEDINALVGDNTAKVTLENKSGYTTTYTVEFAE